MEDPYACDICNKRLVLTSDGKLVCPNCGVVKEYVLVSQPYMYYDKTGRDRQYVYTDQRAQVFGVGSKVGGGDRHAGIRRLDELIKVRNWSLNPRILASLEDAANRLGLTRFVVRSAIQLYLKASKRKDSRDLNSYVLAAASLLVASWLSDISSTPTISEMALTFRNMGHLVTRKKLARGVSFVRRLAGSEIDPFMLTKKYVARIANSLFLDPKVRLRLRRQRKFRRLKLNVEYYKTLVVKAALKLISDMPLKLRLGRNPYVLAASAVYLGEKIVASQFNIEPTVSQKILSEISGISEYSIRDNVYVIRSGYEK